MLRLMSILVMLKLVASSPFLVTVDDEVEENLYRLPTTVVPSSYDIVLTIESNFSTTKTFVGSVRILLRTEEVDVTTIRLHSSSITYNEAFSLTAEDNDTNIFSNYTLETDHELMYISLTDALLPNVTYTLAVDNYIGILHEDMYGFYVSSYISDSGVEEWIATTQFESTYARRAFPSFDEPRFKAVFQVTIRRPTTYTTLSNTNKRTDGQPGPGGLVTDTYEPTPTMSTYLLAFIVSKFKAYEGSNSTYGVWSREEALPTAKYSFEIGPPLLAALAAYVDIPYESSGIGKMDQVAIPDFAAGAMENWGLVTYRETSLLWDEEESTAINKQRVAAVIAHEFAHMWFGNLITLDWWAFTWLNEGFARYLQYFITAGVETGWELEKQFIIEQQQNIFGADALTGALPLSSDVNTPSEITNKFASISYNKGASVIRMMRNFIGEDNFKQGLHDYLTAHTLSNTVPDDLFDAIAPLVNENSLPINVSFADVMTSWTVQAGFPVVTVALRENDAVLTQTRFLLDPTQVRNESWYVPITYTISHGPNFADVTPTYWLLPDEELVIPDILHGGSGWVVANVLESGYYRVNYDSVLWGELETVLNGENYTVIDVINRAQIVDDSLNLARADIITYNLALEVTSFLSQETEYYPWFAGFNAFSFLRRRIAASSQLGIYLKTHLQTLMTKLYESVTFDLAANATHIEILKTALALQWACELDEETCISTSLELFTLFKENGTTINPNIRSVVYCTALRNDDSGDNWNFLWDKFTETKLATEQALIITALGCTKDEALAHEYLIKSITPNSGIRRQDANSVFSAVLAGNPGGIDVAFNFLQENFTEISINYGGMNALTSVLTGVADRITTNAQIEALERFVDLNVDYLADAALQITSSIESARANIAWVTSNQVELTTWLEGRYKEGAGTSLSLSLTALFAGLMVVFLNFH